MCRSWAALVLPMERRSEGIGYFALSMTLATAAGPFWGMKLQAGGYGEIFFVSSVLSIIVLLACWLVKVPALEAVADSRNGSRYFERRAIPLGVIGFFMGMSYSGIISFFSVYAKSISLEGAGQYFFLLYAVVILLSRPVLGRQIDGHTKEVMLGIFIFFALGMGMLGAADSAVILLGSAVMTGLGYGSFIPAVQAILVRSMEPQHIAVAIATFLALLDIGMGLGAYVLGALVPVLGYRLLYALLTAVILGCMVGYLILQGKQSDRSWHRA
ncbi:MAG: MFS transporter [Anaerotignum sp.]